MSVSRVVLMASFVACAQSQSQGSVTIVMPGSSSGTGVSGQSFTGHQGEELSYFTTLGLGSTLWREEFPGETAKIVDFPSDHYIGSAIAVPKLATVPAGAQGFFECPATPKDQTCDLYVFLYECHPCEVVHNQFPRDLVSLGYTRTRCGPLFTLFPGAPEHKMTAFVKNIEPGATETITFSEDVRYVVAGLVSNLRGGVNCPQLNTVDQCLDDGNLNFCKFSANGCDYNSCQTVGVYPPNAKGCEVCAPLS